MKKISLFLLLLIMLTELTQVYGGFKDNAGIGFNIGSQRIYGDNHVRPAWDLAGEGFINYYLRYRKLSIIPGVGIGWLKSTDERNPNNPRERTTDMFTFDLKAAFWPLPEQKYNPYVYGGLGIFNFSAPWNKSERYFDGSFIMGGGLEFMVDPKIGINTTLDYRYTTGDDLDGVGGGASDGYLNVRIGMTFYFKPKAQIRNKDFVINPIDENFIDASFDSLGDESRNQNQSDYTTEEFIMLKARLDELNDRISEKESEIIEVKNLIEVRKEKIGKIESGEITPSAPPASIQQPEMAQQSYQSSGAYAGDYESGLESFYAKNYDATISIMSDLLQKNSQDRMAGNYQYWIGEAYYGKRDYRSAISAFEMVLDYPNSPKLDDAMLMLGRCYVNIGDLDRASGYLNQLIKDFPQSEYLEKAELLLDQM